VDSIKQALLQDRVPAEWNFFYFTKSLTEWIRDLHTRVEFVRTALNE